MRHPTARAEAKKLGLKTYETGIPCKQGHLAPRAIHTGTCVECIRLAKEKWGMRNPSKLLGYVKAYRERNREEVLKKDREAHARRWKEQKSTVQEINRKSYKKKVGDSYRPLNKLPQSIIEERLQEAHAGKIVYVGGFISVTRKAKFRCVEHEAVFEGIPHNVLRGANACPQCNHMRSSAEDAVFTFVSNLVPAIQRDRTTIAPRELDVFAPQNKLAIEYCGMYWHSHGSKEEELKNKRKHYQKYLDCKQQGIRLITLYETEWVGNNYAIRRLLRHALNKSRGKLMARKCELRKVSNAEAGAFFDRYHPQGGAGSGEHYALLWNGKIVACMRFVIGANDRGMGAKTRTWTLGRFATRITISGAASRLFKAFIKDFDPSEVKSFSDNRFFEGGMYEQLKFVMESEVAPDYQVWSPKLGLLPKSHYQRRVLPRRLLEHGIADTFNPETDPRTEMEMTYLMGARRIYDCGKKRWIYRKSIDAYPVA